MSKLGDIVEILDFKRIPLSSKDRENKEKVYPYYGAQGIIDYVDEYIFDGNYILVAEDGNNLKSLNESIATWASGKFWVNNHAHILGPKDGTDLKYVFYLLKTMNLSGCVTGSAQPKLTQNNLASIELNLPDYETQTRVSTILSSIDNKIENNNKINAELESLAKTIYDYWFLQFEFPNEEGKPYKSSGGKMVWNKELKREIPDGWKVSNIKNYCEITDCLHSKKPDFCFENEDCYLLSLENLTKEGHIDLTNKYYIKSKDYKEWIKRIEIKENDFVVTNAGRAGDICKVPRNVKCAIGRNITAIRPFNIDPNYLYCFFKSIYVKEQIQSNLDCGSFFMSFNVKSIKKINLLIPTNDVLNKIDLLLQPIIKQIEMNIQENNRLSSLRDFLLPMLMNGQVQFK